MLSGKSKWAKIVNKKVIPSKIQKELRNYKIEPSKAI